jgi:hypothetical protein
MPDPTASAAQGALATALMPVTNDTADLLAFALENAHWS